ncbi:MAG: hypothetical protein KKB51_05120 [Candidatus Riflebacteria bacterium]|nr:hypothetical protein [Candidatus Riflebacteria bacterium]
MSSDVQNLEFQELTPVICEKCGSAIPLVDTELTDCIYCNAPVVIPPNYRRGQETRNRLTKIRQHASDFLSRLGSRPRKLEIWISLLPSWAFLMILIFLTIIGFSISAFAVELGLSNLIGTNATDYFPEVVIVLVYLGSLFLFFGLPMAAFFLVRRRVFVTRRLMKVLAAGEPIKPGGPVTCRRCGGPFQTAANETVAACAYCGTENFLQVPPEWLSATRKLTNSSGRNVFWAEREFTREMTSSHSSLTNQLKVFGIFIMFLAGAFISADTSKMKVWSNDVAKEVRPIYGRSPDVAVPEIGKPFKLHGLFRKYDNKREFKYSIALKNHECLVISAIEEGPVKVLINGRYTLETLPATIGEPAEFSATPGGWFDFVMAIPADKPLPLIKVDLK